MRVLFIWLLLVGAVRFSYGQDPTVPSSQIMERIRGERVPADKAEAGPVPIVKLKAIVLRDADHGTALLELEGRHVRLTLDRERIASTVSVNATTNEPANHLDGIQIQGATYTIQDFSARSILLNARGQMLLVQ